MSQLFVKKTISCDCRLSTLKLNMSKRFHIHDVPPIVLAELATIGWSVDKLLAAAAAAGGAHDLFETTGNGQLCAHVNCALWSHTLSSKQMMTSSSSSLLAVANMDTIVIEALKRKCSVCNRFGANVQCMRSGSSQEDDTCHEAFHLPCATSIGVYQTSAKQILCPAHINDAKALRKSPPPPPPKTDPIRCIAIRNRIN